jgi:hypothetical protein
MTMARSTRRPPALDPHAELTQLARDLDLTALADGLPDLLGRAERETLSYTDFALALLRAEMTARQDRRLQRSLRRSHLGAVEGLDGYDSVQRGLMWSERCVSVDSGGRGRADTSHNVVG